MIKKSIAFFFVLVLCFFVTACDGPSGKKSLQELTADEHEAMSKLISTIYKSVVKKGQTCFFYETSYYMMPKSDGSIGEKLKDPIILESFACIGPYMLLPETIETLKEAISNIRVKWRTKSGKKKSLTIIESFIEKSPGGAGATMYSSNDMVTIVPVWLEVK